MQSPKHIVGWACIWIWILFVGTLAPLQAQDEQTNTADAELIQPANPDALGGKSPSAPQLNDSGRGLWGYIFLLFIVIGGCYIIVRGKGLNFAKRLGGSENIEVLDTRSLGNRQYLSVVRVYRQRILLSTSPQGVQMLTTLDDAAEETGGQGEGFDGIIERADESGKGESRS